MHWLYNVKKFSSRKNNHSYQKLVNWYFCWSSFMNAIPKRQICFYSLSARWVKNATWLRTAWWTVKNWCCWTVVLEKTLKSHLDCKKIQPVHPKGDQSWIFMEGLMLKLKLQYLGHLTQRTDSFEKTLILGKIEGERRGQPRMRWLDGITDKWTWVWINSRRQGQGGLACCSPWGHKESDTTERLNWTKDCWVSYLA